MPDCSRTVALLAKSPGCCSVCRLLHHNVQEARRVVAAPVPPIARFAEEQSPEQRDRIFDELNTLAVVYRQPSSAFTTAAPSHKEVCCSALDERMLQPTASLYTRTCPITAFVMSLPSLFY